MGLDLTIKTTEFIVDEYGLMKEKSPSWEPVGSYDLDDALNCTLDSYIAYENKIFIEGVKKCFVKESKNGKEYIQGYRHPSMIGNITYNDMSRDQTIYALVALKYANETDKLKELSKGLRYKISDKFSMTPDMWLWVKGIAGNWFAMTLFYILEIILVLFYTVYNKIIYKIGNFGPELPQDQFKEKSNEEKGKLKVFLSSIEYPMYAYYQVLLMNYVSDKSIFRTILMKISKMLVDKENYLFCLLTGKKVNKEDIYKYKSMVGYRWTTQLNDLTNRDIYIITDPKLKEANSVDVDIIRTLYSKFN